VENHGDLSRKSLEGAKPALRRVKKVVGNNLDKVDLMLILEYCGGEIRTPTKTDPVYCLKHRLSSRNHRIPRHSRLHRNRPHRNR
jgi:hypothetical protein